jgi:hypothetical protein
MSCHTLAFCPPVGTLSQSDWECPLSSGPMNVKQALMDPCNA